MDDLNIPVLDVLTPVAETLFEHHIDKARPWYPHRIVPRGKLGTADVAQPAASALYINLLTEDNLPHYFLEISDLFGSDGIWGRWARRWTSEEGRHSIVIRNYVEERGLLNLDELEDARMAQVAGGQIPHPKNVLEGFVYVALQELATRVAHRNTGEWMPDPVGKEVMVRVAADESLHYAFYRDVVKAALEHFPAETLAAIASIVRTFHMPGTGIPNYRVHADAIAEAGIYDAYLYVNAVLRPCIFQQWKIREVSSVSEEATESYRRIVRRVAAVERMAGLEHDEKVRM